MLRITLAALCFLLLAVLVGLTVGGEADHQSARSVAVSRLRTAPPFAEAVLCHAGEKQCRMASYITWCCGADQQCDYSTIGGCSQLGGR